MICHSYPKINIGLKIIKKREDGYHDIETIFYLIKNFYDIIEISSTESGGITLNIKGKYTIPADKKNICFKAVQLLQREFSFIDNLHIEITKNIPIGAGLGGGSSNAASVLKMLNAHFNLNLTKTELIHYAQQLGSDVPFFIDNKVALGTGRGDILESLNFSLEKKIISVFYLEIYNSTEDSYRNCLPKSNNYSLKDAIYQPIEKWRDTIFNDFEDAIFVKYPKLKEMKERLYEMGADYVSMSGSGSTIYAIGNQEYKL